MQDESDKTYLKLLKWIKVTFAYLLLLLLLLSLKIYLLQIANFGNLRSLRNGQSISTEGSNNLRGAIYSREKVPLAFSQLAYSIYVNPSDVEQKSVVAQQLGDALGIDSAEIGKKLEKTISTQDGIIEPAKFVWVKRKASENQMQNVKTLKCNGIGIIEEYKRSYPYHKMASHILGFVGIDENGLEGVELKKDKDLRVANPANYTLIDGRRLRISSGDDLNFQKRGDVFLTIDFTLQQIVEEELDAAFEQWKARSISCVAINPSTGEILALANRPAFDPNESICTLPNSNLTVTDPYEPGSVMKAFLAAAALDAKILTATDRFDCEMGEFKVGNRTIHDHKPFGILTFTDIIAHSSDVGAVKIGLNVGSEILHDYLSRFGFGKKTGVDLPGESSGRLDHSNSWSYYTLTSVSMGYEILATPLQLATGFSALVNGGFLFKPYVVGKVAGYDTNGTPIVYYQATPQIVRRCISNDTSLMMRKILTQTVEYGTASKIKITGFKFGGKTGTAVKLDPQTKKYARGKYASSFVSFAPADYPKICIAVVVQEPKGAYYGGDVAAPIVGKIISRFLPNLLDNKQANSK